MILTKVTDLPTNRAGIQCCSSDQGLHHNTLCETWSGIQQRGRQDYSLSFGLHSKEFSSSKHFLALKTPGASLAHRRELVNCSYLIK